jgi:hypothetical protein
MSRLSAPTRPEATQLARRLLSPGILLAAGIACLATISASSESQRGSDSVRPASESTEAVPPVQHQRLRVSWGHKSVSPRTFRVSFLTNRVAITRLTPEGFGPGDSFENGICVTRAGGGDIDGVTLEVAWQTPVQPRREVQSIWQYLLDHGEPGQVQRLQDDPGLQPDAPVLTVLLAEDGTRGFSLGLEQLARQAAFWLPEHDVFVTLADTPVDFATL